MFGMSAACPMDDDDDLGGDIVEIGKRLLDDGAHDALLEPSLRRWRGPALLELHHVAMKLAPRPPLPPGSRRAARR
jgi:hypothetical protein